MSPTGAFLLIGSGPGIGRTTATYFAEKGFKHLILLSRNTTRLAEDADAVRKVVPDAKVTTLPIDLAADQESVRKVLGQVDEVLKRDGVQLECVLYNGARVGPSKILEWDVKGLEEDLRITTVSLYTTLQWSIPHLLTSSSSSKPTLNPAFLVTSGGLYRDPYPFLFSLSAAKASQHNLVTSFHRKYEPKIHIAAVPISGLVSDEAKVTTAKAVAEVFWGLFDEKKGVEGRGSVEMVDPDYEVGVEGFRRHVEGE